MLHDPDGKKSFGRGMILLGVAAMFAAALLSSKELQRAAELVFTTFMGWEARKSSVTVSANSPIRDHLVNGVSAPSAPEPPITE